jgi:hypothetical protein
METRFGLLEVAHAAFQWMLSVYPDTGKEAGIYERSPSKNAKSGSKEPQKMTLWTRLLCYRGCNLCVSIYWALDSYLNMPAEEKGTLALNRIGTHSLECGFGEYRSVLRHDTRKSSMISVQAASIAVREVMGTMYIDAFIDRFKETAGCTLNKADGTVQVDFYGILEPVSQISAIIRSQKMLKKGSQGYIEKCAVLVRPFQELLVKLRALKWTDKFDRSSEDAGYGLDRNFRKLEGGKPK